MANVHMPYSDDLEVSGKQGSYNPNDYDPVNLAGAPQPLAYNQFDTVIKGDNNKQPVGRMDGGGGYGGPPRSNYGGKSGCAYKYCACLMPCIHRLKQTWCFKRWKLSLAILLVVIILLLVIILPIVLTQGYQPEQTQNRTLDDAAAQFRSSDEGEDILNGINLNDNTTISNVTIEFEPANYTDTDIIIVDGIDTTTETTRVTFEGKGIQPYPVVSPPPSAVQGQNVDDDDDADTDVDDADSDDGDDDNKDTDDEDDDADDVPRPGIQPYSPQPNVIPVRTAPVDTADIPIEGRSLDGQDFAIDNSISNTNNEPVPLPVEAVFVDSTRQQPSVNEIQEPTAATTVDSILVVAPNQTLEVVTPTPATLERCIGRGFTCATSNRVIKSHKVCDGLADCGDQDTSDENACTECLTALSCLSDPAEPAGKRVCLRGSGNLCGSLDHGCAVGHPLNTDTYCNRTCDPGNEWRCAGLSSIGQSVCIPVQWRCDGDRQCEIGDDELDCKQNDCKRGSKWCETRKMCLPQNSVCNGVDDCGDGSDELNCTCDECNGDGVVLCASAGRCIQRTQVCDGVPDCDNGADEANCSGSSIP